MGKGGKSGGKILFSLGLGLLSGGFSFFGGGLSFMSRAILGASLGSSIWSATHKPKTADMNSPNIQRFDKAQETMSSSATIPVVYGYRKISGNQTYHKTNADQNTLNKHITLCEGGIEGIESVSANDLLIPTGSQTKNTVFTIQNLLYEDATVRKEGKHLYLFCNGSTKDLYLANKDDASNADTLWSWQTSVPELITYINKIGNGWQAFPTATTSKYPGDLNGIKSTSCYKKPVNIESSTVTGGTKYEFHDSVIPDNYEEVGGYPKMAWLNMTFMVSNELNGNPSVSCFVKGRKVYDTRTGKTEYSTNPAMCLRDFILSKRFGLGKWITTENIDEDSFKEVADYCDEIITYKGSSGETISCKRYELNIVIDQKQSALDWISDILGNFCGYLVCSQDKLFLRIEKPDVIAYKFNDNNASDLSVAPLALDDTPNCYKISFIDPLNNWNSVQAIVEDFADQKNRGKIITKEVSLEGTTSQNQALRLARFYRDYNAICFKTISFKTGQQAMHLEPGDVFEFSFHNVFKDEPFRITEIKENNDGTFEISARSYNKDIYNDFLGTTIQVYSYATKPSSLFGAVPEIKRLDLNQNYYINKDGTVVSNIIGKMILPTYEYFHRAFIYYSIDDGLTWLYFGSTNGDEFIVNNVKTQTNYMFKIIIENTSGRRSEGVITDPYFITGKDIPPSNITEGRVWYNPNSTEIQLIWEAVSDKDLKCYEIQDDNFNIIGRTTICSFNYALNDDSEHKFYIYAVDNGENKSETPLELIAQRDIQCENVDNLIVTQDGINLSQLNISWSTLNDSKLKNYTIYVNGKNVASTEQTEFKYVVNASGTYTVGVKSRSIFDTESSGTFKTIEIKIEPEDITDFNMIQLDTDRSNLQFTWNLVQHATYYEIRMGEAWETAKFITKTSTNNFVYQLRQEGSFTFMIKAIGYNNVYSLNAKSLSFILVLKPDAVTNLKITQNIKDKSQILISWTPPKGNDIAGYKIFVNDDLIGTSAINNYTYEVDFSMDIIVSVVAYTIAGFESNKTNESAHIMVEPYDVTGFSGTQNVAKKSEIHLYWQPPDEYDINHYELRIGESWDNSTLVSNYITNNYYDMTINVEKTFNFWIKAVSNAGFYSLNPANFECTFDLNPSAPKNLTLTQNIDNRSIIDIKWDAVPEFDVSHYELRYGYIWSEAPVLATTSNTNYSFKPDAQSGNIKVMLKAINTSGFYSDEVSANLYATYEPSDVTGFMLYQNGDYVEFLWNKSTDTDCIGYEIREGETWDTGNVVATMISTTSFELKVNFKGTFKYMIKAINRSGKYSVNAISKLISIENLSEKNVILNINEVARKDGIHNNTEFQRSTITFQTLKGKFSDYDNLMFGEVGGANVLRLKQKDDGSFYTQGIYTCEVIDVSKIVYANISMKFRSSARIIAGLNAYVEIRTSKDNIEWSEWINFIEAQYNFRYVQFRCILSSNDSNNTVEVNTFEIFIDVPDREIVGSLDVPIGGTIVEFDKEFYTIPVVTPYALGYGIRCEITDKTKKSFKVRVLDENNQDVGGQVNWRARGY